MSSILSHIPRRRAGFSLVELLVVVAILVILAGIFIAYVSKIRETDRRVRCADNLRAIMDGLRQYAILKATRDPIGNKIHGYPSVTYDPTHGGYVAYTGGDSTDPFAKNSQVKPNDVTASLWLLVRDGFVPATRFICPSGNQSIDPMLTAGRSVPATERSNFTSGAHLSYSYASPFSAAPGYKMQDTNVGDFALLADKNPGLAGKNNNITAPSYNSKPFDLSRANSNNHGKVGQNVLYADAHVSWQTTVYCGVGNNDHRDNIYTALSPIPLSPGDRPPVESNGFYGPEIGPSWTNDSYLVPTDDE